LPKFQEDNRLKKIRLTREQADPSRDEKSVSNANEMHEETQIVAEGQRRNKLRASLHVRQRAPEQRRTPIKKNRNSRIAPRTNEQLNHIVWLSHEI